MSECDSIPFIRQVQENELFSGILTKQNAIRLSESLSEFQSVDNSLNSLLQMKFQMIQTKNDYDNREIIQTYFHDSPRFKRPRLVAVVCFCASCVRTTVEVSDKDGSRLEEINLPATKILTFAVSKKYTKRYAVVNTVEGQQESVANFIFSDFMRYLDDESRCIGITHAHILLNHPIPVVEFFHKLGFYRYTADTRSFEHEIGDHDYCYIRVLENAKKRKIKKP